MFVSHSAVVPHSENFSKTFIYIKCLILTGNLALKKEFWLYRQIIAGKVNQIIHLVYPGGALPFPL